MPQKSIRIYTRRWCEDSQAAKEFLDARHIPYEEIDIEDDPEGASFVMKVNGGKRRTPTVQTGDRAFHCSPFKEAVFACQLGLDETPA